MTAATILELALPAVAALLASLWLTGVVRRMALRRGVLDVPNSRSSHAVPTPRGGGLAIVVALYGVLSYQTLAGGTARPVIVALAGGLPVALIGLIDDNRPVTPLLRLVVHIAAAAWAVAWLGGMPPIQVGAGLVGLGPLGPLFGVLGIIWVLNLFNFMDGIDGIAAVEGVYVGFAGGALMLLNPADSGLSGISLAFGAACAGFLVWNWAPARIFMGDVGSGFVGYVIAVLAVAGAFVDPASLFVWLILGGTFFVDATVTLVLRLARGERLYLAHRSHFYQRLARTWGSHAKVSLAVAAVNVVWLLPWAVAAKLRPSSAVWFALAALLPLIVIVIAGGAGRAETVER